MSVAPIFNGTYADRASRAAATQQLSSTLAENDSGGSANAASKSLLTNYDTFLRLLTAQLRVQDPMSPMDAEKFTEQLVQFSSVEQQIQTNQKLESMLAAMVSSAALGLVNYIGKTVEAAGDITQMKNGKATWTLDSSGAADDASVVIRNSAGAIVHEGTMDLTKGENTFEWDGKLANGQTAPDGAYQIEVKGTKQDGSAVTINTRVKGVVTGVDTSGSEPFLTVNGMKIPLSGLLNVTAT